MRQVALALCLGCAPDTSIKKGRLDTAEAAPASGWDTGPVVHGEQDTGSPGLWGCSDGPTVSQAQLDAPRDHSEGHRYRVVPVQTDAFDVFYVIVIYPPASYRSLYDAGAPVVVTSMQSIGIGRSWATEPRAYFSMDLGVVEVQPLHPGWTSVGASTPGVHDGAGPQTAQSLAVAADFALGRTTTLSGLSLRDLVNREVCTGQIAILGASSGGITAATAMRNHADSLQGHLVGAAFYETPSMPLFVVGDTGFKALDRWPTEDTDGNGVAWDEGRNPAFMGCDMDSLRCEMDLGTLAWASALTPAEVAPTDFNTGEPGVLYLDRNANGQLDLTADRHPDVNGDGLIGTDEDYFFLPYQDLRTGDEERQLYSPPVAEAAEAIFGTDGTPSHVASAAEATAFWAERNAVNAMTVAAEALDTDVRFAMAFSDEDHSVPVAERPHVAVLYSALHMAGATVRTNLDLEAAVCLIGASRLEGWTGGGSVGADWDADSLLSTALPNALPARTVRAITTLGLFWDGWGHFDVCPGEVSTR